MLFAPRKPIRLLPAFLIALAVTILGAVAPSTSAGKNDDEETRDTAIPLSIARIYIEFNASANDLGFHVLLDGQNWKEIEIVNPDGITVFEVEGHGAYEDMGMTELFFEGAEPSLDEVPLEDLLALFPEGEYEFSGETVEGEELAGTGVLTHNVPTAPVIVSPKSGQLVNRDNVVIKWKAVTTPPGIQIVGYQVLVGSSLAGGSSFIVPASQKSLWVPPEVLSPRTEYPFEVLAIEVGGNQTITEGSFKTK